MYIYVNILPILIKKESISADFDCPVLTIHYRNYSSSSFVVFCS